MTLPECNGRRALGTRGFTLLEVLVAVAIVGLSLTVILSSQVGLFSSAQFARDSVFASNLARCRMTELELKLLKNGYPQTDETEEGACCEDESDSRFGCEWKIEKVELPAPAAADTVDGGNSDSKGKLGKTDPGELTGSKGGGDILSKLAALQGGGLDAGGGGLGLSGDAGGGLLGTSQEDLGGFAAMAMSMVYPQLKPMLEASIRRVSVKVKWLEGNRERDFVLVQFLTNPTQGGLMSGQMLDQMMPGSGLVGPGPTATGASTAAPAKTGN